MFFIRMAQSLSLLKILACTKNKKSFLHLRKEKAAGIKNQMILNAGGEA